MQDKDLEDWKNEYFEVCASSMQGYKKENQDAHLVSINSGPNRLGLFAVFDGHGSKAPAQFCEHFMMDRINARKEYIDRNKEKGLQELFGHIDECIKS